MDNDVERVRQLFRLGCPAAVVNVQNADGRTALFCASARGHEAAMRELLANGADVNIKSKTGLTPLMFASTWSLLAIVRLLCDAPGVDLAARGGYSMKLSALGRALYRKRVDVAAFLRARGAPE